MTTPPLKTLILAVQNTQDDLLALTWARERLFLVISVFAVILGFKGGGVPGYCEGHGSKFFADDTRFFCVGRLEGCSVLGRRTPKDFLSRRTVGPWQPFSHRQSGAKTGRRYRWGHRSGYSQ